MKCRRLTIIILFAALMCGSALAAQTNNPAVLDRDELFFTYAGGFASGGMTLIDRKGWIDGKEGEKKSSGWCAGGGLLADIYVRSVCGEFTWQYSYDATGDSAASFSHSIYAATAKYVYAVNPIWDLTAGGGLYFEGPPAAKEHGGAGLELTMGTVLTYQKYELKFPIDIRARYGFWGQDAKSTRAGFGLFFGVTKKLGRS